MLTERALAVLFFTELATVTVSPSVALSGSAPSEVAEARTVSCGFWVPTAVVAWAMGLTTSSASPAKATSRTILNVVIICYLLDLLAPLAPGHPCEVIRVGRSIGSTRQELSENSVKRKLNFAESPFYIHDREPIMGVPPSGKRNSSTGVFLHRIVGGKFVEERSLGDWLGPMLPVLEQQLRERVEQELQVARTIQQAALPKEVPQLACVLGWGRN